MPMVVGGRLSRLSLNESAALVEQLVAFVREMRQRDGQDRRQVGQGETRRRVVQSIEDLVRDAEVRKVADGESGPTVEAPHARTARPPAAEGARADEREEFRHAQDAGMPVADVRYHGRAAPPGAEHENGSQHSCAHMNRHSHAVPTPGQARVAPDPESGRNMSLMLCIARNIHNLRRKMAFLMRRRAHSGTRKCFQNYKRPCFVPVL